MGSGTATTDRDTGVHEEAREFWEGCEQGRLRVQHCADCGHWQYYPRYVCTGCGRPDPDWDDASGLGTIWSYSVVERGFARFAERTPYVVALVRLAEGPVMMTNVVECEPTDVQLDQAVEVVFRKDETTGATLPCFKPTGTTA